LTVVDIKLLLPGYWLLQTARMGGSGVLLAGKDTGRNSERGIDEDKVRDPALPRGSSPTHNDMKQYTLCVVSLIEAHRCNVANPKLLAMSGFSAYPTKTVTQGSSWI
jgi:hypothetical protein